MIQEFEGKTNLELLAFRPRILTHRIDYRNGRQLESLPDDYLISRTADGKFKLSNIRTGHTQDLLSCQLLWFTPDHLNTPFGLQRGTLTIRGGWWQSGDHAWIVTRNPRRRRKLRLTV